MALLLGSLKGHCPLVPVTGVLFKNGFGNILGEFLCDFFILLNCLPESLHEQHDAADIGGGDEDAAAEGIDALSTPPAATDIL